MTYVDAYLDRKTDLIHLAEKINGQRQLRDTKAEYVFYFEHPSGSYRSIFGHPCQKFATTSSQKFRTELKKRRDCGTRIFESDINPVFRHLADHYTDAEVPTLNIGFFDIEADFHPTKGYAPTDNPFNAITAITLYRTQDAKLLTWVLCPPTVPLEAARKIANGFTDTFMYDDEAELLSAFLAALEPVDCMIGWNSSAYDVPYTVNRVKRILDQAAVTKFCLWDQAPSTREYINKFGKPVTTYDFVGRVHLDYMELYAKHVTQQRQSYALNAIGEVEVGDLKVPYDGTLDDLYKKDLHTFIEYNRQDVMLMVKIDEKLKFIELANQIAHANCVLLKTTMGSVALVEQAIINEMHAMGKVVPDRKPRDEDRLHVDRDDTVFDEENDDDDEEERAPVVGAYVAQPKKGLHRHVGAGDINSLYPSAIRALNMSPETLVGQIKADETAKLIDERVKKLPAAHRADAWEGLFSIVEIQHMHDRNDTMITVDFIDSRTDIVTTRPMTGAQLHDYIFDEDNHVCITANGTIFRTDVEGIIPKLLEKWYAERKSMQKMAKDYAAMAKGVEIDAELAALLQ